MKRKLKRGVILSLSLASILAASADETAFRVKGDCGELTVSGNGMSLSPSDAACPASEATGEAWWAVSLEPAPGSRAAQGTVVLDSSAQAQPKVKATRDGVTPCRAMWMHWASMWVRRTTWC